MTAHPIGRLRLKHIRKETNAIEQEVVRLGDIDNALANAMADTLEKLAEARAEIERLKDLYECKHAYGTIYDFKEIPATLSEPSEQIGKVECSECGQAWELGYQPENMELEAE